MPFWKELIEGLLNVSSWSKERAVRYLRALQRLSFIFLACAAVLFFALFLGIFLRQSWLISTAGLLIGIATAMLLVLATPLAVPMIWTAQTFKTVRMHFSVVVGVLLWLFLFSLYVSIVPISNNPKAIVLILLFASVIAILWVRYGFGPNLRRVYASVIIVFLFTTAGFFFPKTFEAASALSHRLDEKIANWLTNPSIWFASRPHAVDTSKIPTLEFFDTSTGAPRYWYHRSTSGEYELFDAPGYHPRTRDTLRPVTPEVIEEIIQWFTLQQPPIFIPKVPPALRQEIPDLSRALVAHRALSLADLNVARAIVTENNPNIVRGYFNVTTLQSRRIYTPVVIQINKEVTPHIFITARVYGDNNIHTLELQALDVHFIVDNHSNYYTIYNSEENQMPWKPLPFPMDEGVNTLGLYQVNRRVLVFLNSQFVDSFNLWNTPSNSQVGLFFKANPNVQAHAHFHGLAVYQF